MAASVCFPSSENSVGAQVPNVGTSLPIHPQYLVRPIHAAVDGKTGICCAFGFITQAKLFAQAGWPFSLKTCPCLFVRQSSYVAAESHMQYNASAGYRYSPQGPV
jgi:hypothetical protein